MATREDQHYEAAVAANRYAKRIAELDAQQKMLLWEKAVETSRANRLERRVATQRRRITSLIGLVRRMKSLCVLPKQLRDPMHADTTFRPHTSEDSPLEKE